MESFEISQRETGMHIEGFPEAVKVIGIESLDAKRLADLALHKADLEFANRCLEAINAVTEEPYVLREALWRSAIVHYLKCFGRSNARIRITPEEVLQGEPSEAMEAFKYFKALRDKHLVHDENSYAQSIPGAILNDGSKSYKVEKIVCFSAVSVTLGQENFSNLKLLIERALSWVVREFDELCNVLTAELEKEPYAELLARSALTYTAPKIDDLHKNRHAL